MTIESEYDRLFSQYVIALETRVDAGKGWNIATRKVASATKFALLSASTGVFGMAAIAASSAAVISGLIPETVEASLNLLTKPAWQVLEWTGAMGQHGISPMSNLVAAPVTNGDIVAIGAIAAVTLVSFAATAAAMLVREKRKSIRADAKMDFDEANTIVAKAKTEAKNYGVNIYPHNIAETAVKRIVGVLTKEYQREYEHSPLLYNNVSGHDPVDPKTKLSRSSHARIDREARDIHISLSSEHRLKDRAGYHKGLPYKPSAEEMSAVIISRTHDGYNLKQLGFRPQDLQHTTAALLAPER